MPTFRAMRIARERLGAKHRRVAYADCSEDCGVAVRVLADGAWGFAAGGRLDRDSLGATARLAVANARAAGRLRRAPVEPVPEPVHRDRWETPLERDPFAVPLAEKLDLLVGVSAALEDVDGVAVGESDMAFTTEQQWYGDTNGSDIEQTIHFAAAGCIATSRGPGGIQKRSYPNSWSQVITGGYELVDELDLLAHAGDTARECVALQTADKCPSGEFDLILDPKQLTLQIHESVGHPLELDRVLGIEANFAGTSFATPDLLGTLQYGSPLVNLIADATLPRGVATFGYDDEGVAAQKWMLVEDGILRSYLTSREFAPAIGETRSRGAMRAQGWAHVPIVRMVNISLLPGREPLTLEELIADTKHGLYMTTNRSWSIDQRRVNFQFGCEAAWEIRDGKLGRLLRDPNYQGITTEFWGSCDAICDEREWQAWGINNCGKGEPMQVAQMSHGSSPARFRGVRCGVT
ncbi:MAG: TldD/PmbA family protein [Armatimonadetes bacterium]|nr:TldD/PmbA family protein [Armatimonadota bacterium]